MSRPPKKQPEAIVDYTDLLDAIKQRVERSRIRAAMAANAELVALYWDIGRMILARQKREGWGSKVIDRLARDLQKSFPGRKGFSPRNLKYMRSLAAAWPDGLARNPPSLPASDAADEPEKQSEGAIVQAPLAQLPWYHHTILLDKLSSPELRIWYAAQAIEHGWSGNVLALQIDGQLHQRVGKAVTNFDHTLPPERSDLAQSITKDPYLFDFLDLQPEDNERRVEDGLVAQVEKFLLELGAGFALVGRQIHLEVGGRDFYLDLLFYHWKLRAFVVIDLKAREFTPEAAGKMNFYLSAVDERYRQNDDHPSIGLILCRSSNRVMAEYALRDISKPIGVSGYVTHLVDSLPEALRGSFPSVDEIETELGKSLDPKN